MSDQSKKFLLVPQRFNIPGVSSVIGGETPVESEPEIGDEPKVVGTD